MAIQKFDNTYYSESGLQKGVISAATVPKSAYQDVMFAGTKTFSFNGITYQLRSLSVDRAYTTFPLVLPVPTVSANTIFHIPFKLNGSTLYLHANINPPYYSYFGLQYNGTWLLLHNNVADYMDGNSRGGLCVTLYNGDWYLGMGSQPSPNTGVRGNFFRLLDLQSIGLSGGVFSPSFGNASTDEGYDGGTFDNSSDIVNLPDSPKYGVSSAGFVNVYRTSINSLKQIGSELFPTPQEIIDVPVTGEGTLADIVNALNSVTKTIGNLFLANASAALTNYIIDCHILPVNPATGDAANIRIGYKESVAIGSIVTSDYVDFDCGSLNVGEYFANFMDYVGTTIKLYLPFIGFVPIKNEYVQGATISIKYRFNVIDGSFMCFVLSSPKRGNMKDSVIATYSGNCCVHIPITGLNYASMVSGVVANVGAGASALSGGNVAGAFTGAMNAIASRPDIQQSNGYNSTSAYLGGRTPYLLFSRQIPSFSESYNKEKGLPLNVTKKIGDLTGFTKIDTIILDNLSIYEEEKDELLNMLREGVIL